MTRVFSYYVSKSRTALSVVQAKWHCEQTCISMARINDSKPKQIVNLNKQLFGVRIGVWT